MSSAKKSNQMKFNQPKWDQFKSESNSIKWNQIKLSGMIDETLKIVIKQKWTQVECTKSRQLENSPCLFRNCSWILSISFLVPAASYFYKKKPLLKQINFYHDKLWYFIYLWPVAEFKEFERRFKFKPRFKYGWFHLKLYQMFQDLI